MYKRMALAAPHPLTRAHERPQVGGQMFEYSVGKVLASYQYGRCGGASAKKARKKAFSRGPIDGASLTEPCLPCLPCLPADT